MRSCRSRRTSSLMSTTVTSFASSRESWYAAVRPTWPAPRMTIFMWGASIRWTRSYGLEVGVLQHEPLGALALEAHLHPRMGAVALDVEDHALAEAAVAHAGAEAHA